MNDKAQKAPVSPETLEKKEKSPEIVKEASKKEREELEQDVREGAEKGGFENFFKDLWAKIKEEFGGVWDMIKKLFGKEGEEEESEVPAKTISTAEKEKAAKIVENAKSPEEAIKQLKAEAEKQQKEDLNKLEAKGKIMPGESAEIAYWCEGRQEVMGVTTEVTPDGGLEFYVANTDGSVKYKLDLPWPAKIEYAKTSEITKGTLQLKINVKEDLVPVSTKQIFTLIERMATKKEAKIVLHTKDRDVDVKQIGNDLPDPKPLNERYKDNPPEKKEKTVDKSWYEKLTDGAKEWWNSVSNIPEQVRVYWNLREKVGEIDELLDKAEATEDHEEQEGLCVEIAEKLVEVVMIFGKAEQEIGKLPRVFMGLLKDLEEQKGRMEKLPHREGYFNRAKRWVTDSKLQRDAVVQTFTNTINAYAKTIDDEPGLYDDVVEVIDEVGEYGETLTDEAKAEATVMLQKRLQKNPLFAGLPETMQKLCAEKMIELAA